MTAAVEIREARPEDAVVIAELMSTLGYPTNPAAMAARLDRISAHADHMTLVAELEGRVVGMAGLVFGLYYEHDGAYMRIAALSVAPDATRRGVGRTLLEAAERKGRERGARACLLNSGNHRIEAHRFYERMGFASRGMAFHKPLG